MSYMDEISSLEKDFKKIKLQKLRQAAKKVDKKGFRSESESDE